jgi:hypothetical protein
MTPDTGRIGRMTVPEGDRRGSDPKSSAAPGDAEPLRRGQA